MVSKKYNEMMAAITQGRIEDVKSLLNDKSVDINEKNSTGWTALQYASHKDHCDVVELLLDNGADIEARISDCYVTPLIRACYNGHMSIVELLLDRGADIHAVSKNSIHSLYHACNKGHDSVVKLLLKHGANANSCTKKIVNHFILPAITGM